MSQGTPRAKTLATTHRLSVRIPASLWKDINREAKEKERSASWVAIKRLLAAKEAAR